MNIFIGRLRILWLGILFITGCVLSLYLYHERRKETDETAYSYFVDQAQSLGLQAQQMLQENVKILDAFSAFFAASNEVTREEFQAFASHLLADHPEISAIYWAPSIESQQRPAFEAELKNLGGAKPYIWDAPKAQQNPQAATSRPLYFPVYFAEPLAQNRALIGLDIQSHPAHPVPLSRAVQLSELQTTAPFPNLQNPQGAIRVALYLPVRTANPTESPNNIRGYLGLAISPEILLKQRLQIPPLYSFTLALSDPLTQQVIARNAPLNIKAWSHQATLRLPGRFWQLSITSNPLQEDHTPEWFLGSLLLLTSVITLAMAHSTRQMQQLVQANAKLRQQSEVLSQQARTDALTGLPNRTHLQELVGPLLANEARLQAYTAICMLDLDHFKQVNDQLGHGTGDMLLQLVAQIFAENLRQGDIAARLGGDEFVLVVPMLKQNTDLTFLLERIQTQIRYQTQRLIPLPLQVTSSIGVAFSSPECRVFDVLLERADQAMYQAKNQGKDRFCFYSESSV